MVTEAASGDESLIKTMNKKLQGARAEQKTQKPENKTSRVNGPLIDLTRAMLSC